MSTAGLTTVRSMINLVREESDMVNSNFVTDAELAAYISNSYKELYDLLVTAYGEDYHVAEPTFFTTNNQTFRYPLPDGVLQFQDSDGNDYTAAPFYKLLGLDFQLTPNNPQAYVTLKTFAFSERNRFSVPNFVNFWGFTNLRYRIQGNFLYLTPLPAGGQVLRMWYVPRPANLVSYVTCGVTDASTTVTATTTEAVQVGATIFSDFFPSGTTVVSKTDVDFVTSSAALGTSTSTSLSFVNYEQTIDGVSGWEEYIIVDASIKCKDKEESDVTVLAARKAGLLKRVEGVAANRDPGTAARTADVTTSYYGYGNGWDGSDGSS